MKAMKRRLVEGEEFRKKINFKVDEVKKDMKKDIDGVKKDMDNVNKKLGAIMELLTKKA